MLLKVNESNALKPLLDCLNDQTFWMSLNLLNLNESKTEIVIFSPSDGYDIQNLNLGHLSCFHNPVVKKGWCAI